MLGCPAPRRMARFLTLSIFLGLFGGALPRSSMAAPAERRATIFYTGAVAGTLEPCGCTSDPLGDVARMTGVVRRAKKEGAVLLVDAGNLTYPTGELPARRRDAADLKASFLATELPKLPFGGSALGESDLARGAERVKPPRLAANLTGPFVAPSRLEDVGGIKVGLLGLADPAVAQALGVKVEDPATAAKREAEALRKRGAEVVIALVPLERPRARQLARVADVDLVVLGKNVEDGLPQAEAVGKAFLVAPAIELQKLGRIDLVLRAGAQGLADAGGPQATRQRIADLARTIADLDQQLAGWKQDRAADQAFVAGKKKERADLQAERERLEKARWQPPASGSYFTNQLIPMSRALPRDPALASAMRALDKAVGAANLRHAEAPPPAPPGRASYVGDQTCNKCHKKAAAFWKTTVHAHAWKTLVEGGKTGDDECVSCHVTGYGEIGGSSLGFTKKLEAVQCETCHGPGSLHVAQEGLEDPPAVRLTVAQSTCQRCHNLKHSDTFQFEAYLRDITGVGHGSALRAKLGDGPSGHVLRSTAMAKAKAAGAAVVQAGH
jgi:hypothetical protein